MLSIAAFVIYAHILHAPFVFDDVTIRDNPAVHAISLFEVFGVLVDDSLDRGIGYFTFALNFYFGGLDTFGYHLTNLFVHIFSAWLIFWLLATTLKLPCLNMNPGTTAGMAVTRTNSLSSPR